jgi:nitrogen fixation protein FixH
MTFTLQNARQWRERSLSGRHVLWVFIAFFGTIFAVNGVLVYSALTTFSGLDGEDAYRRGLAYNAILAEAQQQQQLGWSVKAQLVPGRISIKLMDSATEPVERARVVGTLGRPSVDRWDRQIELFETTPGTYEAIVGALQSGYWIASLTATRPIEVGKSESFRMKERLWLKPTP